MPFDGIGLSQAASDLLAAKHYIETHGWCSNGPRSGTSVCVARAIGNVVNRWDETGLVRFDAASLVFKMAIGGCISTWNNAPERTLAEVFEAFDRAIASNIS